MLQTLTDKALAEAWAVPDRDLQFLIAPTVLTSKEGELNTVYLPYTHIKLPSNGERYMVYQVGQWDPARLGITNDLKDWVKLSDLVDETGLLIQFIINHRFLPTHEGYVRQTTNKALLFAFRHEASADLFYSDYPVMLRLYTNDWYNNPEGSAERKPTYDGVTYNPTVGASAFFTQWAQYKSGVWTSKLFRNGIMLNDVTPSELNNGDNLFIINDRSLHRYFDITLDELESYISEVDSKARYIINSPNHLTNQMRYIDDMEVYVMGTQTVKGITREAGFYVPRTTKGTMRMLTHCDFGIEVNYIQNVISQNDHLADFSDAKLRVYVRKNDSDKSIIESTSYLRQLYQLPPAKRLLLMTGTSSLVPNWRAPQLEKSPYVTFMNRTSSEMSQAIQTPETAIYDVYNYFGLMNALEKSTIIDGKIHWSYMDRKYGCLLKSFDTDGNLFDIRFVDTIFTSMIRDLIPGTVSIETIPGSEKTTADINNYDPNNDYIESDSNEVRYLFSPGEQVKAVLDTDFTIDPDTKQVIWDSAHNSTLKMRIRATDVVVIDNSLVEDEITNLVSLFGDEDPLTFAGELSGIEVYLDSKRAVPGLDYILQYPNIRVLKPMIRPSTSMELRVILHGIPVADDELYPAVKSGWITEDELGRNGKFEFFRDTYSEIYIDGRYVAPDDIRTAEIGKGTLPAWVTNGMSYAAYPRIQHIPYNFVKRVSTGRYVTISAVKAMEDVLDTVYPESASSNPVVINGNYLVVSPLINRLLADIETGNISITGPLSDSAIGLLLAPYAYLREIDPCVTRTDFGYVEIMPTSTNDVVSVSLDEYNFIERVNEIYLNGRCKLNTFISIGS